MQIQVSPGRVLGQVTPGELTPAAAPAQGLTSFTLGHFSGTSWHTEGLDQGYRL